MKGQSLKKYLKRVSAVILSIIVVGGTMNFSSASVMADDAVNYIDEDGTLKECSEYSTVDELCTEWKSDDGEEAWYLVDGDITAQSRIVVTGNVNLILKDGCKLTAKCGINVGEGQSLTIYGQTDDSSRMGKLTAYGYNNNCAGIGGDSGQNCGTVKVNGGSINSHNSESAAAIGGGQRGSGGTIIINGGYVNANISNNADNRSTKYTGAGIGGGVFDASGTVEINGGQVTAYSNGGAAIGNGKSADDKGGLVVITGGTVTAKSYTGTGIGCGAYGHMNTTIITGGNVTAGSTNNAGIGLAQSDENGTQVIVLGGNVEAQGKTSEYGYKYTTGVIPAVVDDETVYNVIGTVEIPVDITIPQTSTILISPDNCYSDASVWIDSGVTVTNYGTIQVATGSNGYKGIIRNSGTIDNHGTITNDGEIVGSGVVVGTGNYSGEGQQKAALFVSSVTYAPKTYDGTKEITITEVTLNGITGGDDVKVEIPAEGIKGTVSSQDAGSYWSVKLPENLTLTGNDADRYALVNLNKNVSLVSSIEIRKADPEITVTDGNNSYTKTYGDESFVLSGITENNSDNDGIVAYSVTDGVDVVSVDDDGNVNILKAGNAEITISLPETKNFNKAQDKKINITVDKALNAPHMPEESISAPVNAKKVSNVSLPDDWKWKESDAVKALNAGEAVDATAVYCGDDSGNYKNESVTVMITRLICNHANTEIINDKPATYDETGYSGDTYCKDCDEIIEEGTEIPRLTPRTYDVLEGAEGEWNPDSDTGFVIRGAGEFSNFTSVSVDGNIVDPADYEVKSGSTIITFKTSYMRALAAGTHTVEIKWTDGHAVTTFTVKAKSNTNNESTGNTEEDTTMAETTGTGENETVGESDTASETVSGGETGTIPETVSGGEPEPETEPETEPVNDDNDNDGNNNDNSDIPAMGDRMPAVWLFVIVIAAGTVLTACLNKRRTESI